MSEHDVDAQAMTEGESWIIPRPREILMDLPYAYRWEFTRRHPYYLRCWELARKHHECPSDDSEQRGLEKSAALILLSTLSISTTPPPPGDGPESLGVGNLGQVWEGGAVAPITFRALASLLLVDLESDLLVQLGRFLADCGSQAGTEGNDKISHLVQLQAMKHPTLDTAPNRPLVAVNINAPQRAITEAIEKMVHQWKDQEGLSERRRRDDKLPEYLTVWDQREGWAGSSYQGNQEQTLQQICRNLKIPLSTAVNRYQSAFRLIVGREYSPALWARVFGWLKASAWLDPEELPRRTMHRPWRDRQKRPAPETALQTPGQDEGATSLLNTAGIAQSEIGYTQLLIDIQDLITQGRGTANIVETLELKSESAPDLIEFMRQRHGEQL